MTKRTVYARYENKAALFKAAVQRSIERLIVPPATLQALETGDIAATLAAVARLRVAQVMTPAGLKQQRIINTESYRFPEIFIMAYEQNTRPVVEFLAALLQRETAAGTLSRHRSHKGRNGLLEHGGQWTRASYRFRQSAHARGNRRSAAIRHPAVPGWGQSAGLGFCRDLNETFWPIRSRTSLRGRSASSMLPWLKRLVI